MIKNLHRYRVDLFYFCLDKHIVELNNQSNEVTFELLLCMSALSPVDSFATFDKVKLVRLSDFIRVILPKQNAWIFLISWRFTGLT